MIYKINKKIIILFVIIIFLTSGCIKLKEGNKGNTLCVVEMFNAIWIQQSGYYNNVIPEIDEELGREKAQFIQYYVESTADHPFPRLSCKESEDRMEWYMKDRGLITSFFNGSLTLKGLPVGGDQSLSKSERLKKILIERINTVNSYTSPVKITGNCINKGENKYELDVLVEALDNIEFNDLRLFVALTENDIPYVAINGTKIHPFVFREFVKPGELKDKNGIEGIPITLLKRGDNYKTSFSFDLNTELYKNELNIVIFVQDYTKKIILQGYGIQLKE